MAARSLPVPACTCGRLRRAARALTQLYDDVMAPSGLRVTQFSLLRTLSTQGTARMSDLARTLLLDRTALSRTLDPLAERGLVIVTSGATHARAK
jgi:DNA-binding MarR family transcriptional regulator